MSRAIIYLALCLGVMIPPSTSADDDIVAGKKLLERGDAWGALTVFAPCLKHPLADADKQVDCLYFGDKASRAVIASMSRHGCRDADIARFNRLGFKTRRLHVTEDYCAEDPIFLLTLQRGYPHSRYRDEVEFLLRGGCDVYKASGGWRDCERHDFEYIEAFSSSEYVALAKLELARMYAELWEVFNEDRSVFAHEGGTGDTTKDARLAAEYRYRALLLYRELLHSQNRLLAPQIRSIAIRYAKLSAGIDSHWRAYVQGD
jgi:hypothetical protein